ncbi:uncharacterized protein LOC117169418 [Belonocnema kinseyi]|uniref:uncharacterized protein LOC117169418 n=1 Tax=Belonocnema kinseyi TaxID=2817044 RepID=UPI00143DD033|nr:uncharacterized protein LOC117169418 [Belonocnema kinseyi]
MKYCNIALCTFIICFSGNVFAQKFDPPLEKVLKEQLNLTPEQFKAKCVEQDSSISQKFHKSRISAAEIANDLADDVVGRAKKLRKVNEEKWNSLIKDRCLTNVVLYYLTESSVDNIVNQCFDEKNRLKGVTKTDFTNALFTEYCESVSKLAKEKYLESKN